jgi:hypothetical protein
MSRISRENANWVTAFKKYSQSHLTTLSPDVLLSFQKAKEICERDEELSEKMNEFPKAHHQYLFQVLEEYIENLISEIDWCDLVILLYMDLGEMRESSEKITF